MSRTLSNAMQRQRHGVAKNLYEAIGGVVVGGALVVLARGLLKQRRGTAPTQTTPAAADPAAAQQHEAKS